VGTVTLQIHANVTCVWLIRTMASIFVPVQMHCAMSFTTVIAPIRWWKRLMHFFARMLRVCANCLCRFRSPWLWLLVQGMYMVHFHILGVCTRICHSVYCFLLLWVRYKICWLPLTNNIATCYVNFPFLCYRYEIGRLDAVSWQRWNENLRLIAASPYNTIAANNRYDQVKHITVHCFFHFYHC